jgi:hypothetical protein
LLFRTLGLCLALADPPAEHRLQVLNDVWRVVSRLTDAGHYVSCAEVWIQFAVRHFSVCEREYAIREQLLLQPGMNTFAYYRISSGISSSVLYMCVSSVMIIDMCNLAWDKEN